MPTQEVPIAPHRFAVGYHPQKFWNWLIGTAFFLGGVGGGTFLISLASGHLMGMIAGFLIVVAGKNSAHVAFLGRPERFWRAAMRPDRSWIARGIWATGLFAVAGFVTILLRTNPPVLSLPPWLADLTVVVAGISALFITCYDGFLMRSSAGVAFWRTLLLPLLLFMYAVLGGITLSITIRELQGQEAPGTLLAIEHALLAANVFLLVVYMLRMSFSLPAARETMRLWLRGTYARAFFGLVVLVGLAATLALSILGGNSHTSWLVVSIAICELIGDFTLMMVMLKSGLFATQTGPVFQSR
jgi:formate-dependent nitrite reductase membrane component NrfD